MLRILFWCLIINVLTFLVWGLDKKKARQGKSRICEKTLLLLSVLGWWLGALFAIDLFRHKTIKSSFLWKFYTIAWVWVVFLFLICFFVF